MQQKDFIVVTTIVAVLAFFEVIRYLFQSNKERKKAELQRRLAMVTDEAIGENALQLLRRERYSNLPALDNFLRGFEFAHRLERLLEQADSERTVAQILFMSFSAFFVPTLAALIFLDNPIGGILIGIFLAFVPVMLVVRARKKRVENISSQLPEALEMMSRSLRAGHALQGAFQLVARELPPPIATEFAKAFEEQKLGKSLEEAVQNMVDRVPGNLDLKIFAVMVVIQKETGGNLIELLEGIAGTVRDRYTFFGKLRVMTSEGKSSAMILCSIPFIVVIALALINPDYLVPLIYDPIGNVMLFLGALSMTIGVVIMNKMTQIEV